MTLEPEESSELECPEETSDLGEPEESSELEYPEEGDKIRGVIELEKKSNEKKVSSVDTNEIIDSPLSDINQTYFRKNIIFRISNVLKIK